MGFRRAGRPRFPRAWPAAGAAVARATVFAEVSDQGIHPRKARGVIDEASVLASLHEARLGKRLEVERQGGRRHVQLRADLAHGKARGPGLDEQSIDREARFLREGCERRDGGGGIHNSIILELWNYASPRCRPASRIAAMYSTSPAASSVSSSARDAPSPRPIAMSAG